jgi:hypothetical protein
MGKSRSSKNGNKASRGNKFTLPQQNNHRSKKSKLNRSESYGVIVSTPTISPTDIINFLSSDKMSSCCTIGKSNKKCCLLKYFALDDLNAVAAFVLDCRSKTDSKTVKDKNDFVQSKFKESICNNVNGKFKMNFVLPGEKKVCKAVFGYCYNISIYDFELCSSLNRFVK